MAKINAKKLKKIWKYYGIKQIPEGVFLKVRGNIRLVSSEAYAFSKKLKGVKSLGISLAAGDEKALTIEGVQMLGISKNAIELGGEEAESLLKGGELDFPAGAKEGFRAVKSGSDCFGTVLVGGDRIYTNLPVWRRLK